MGFVVSWEQIYPVSQEIWDTFLRRALLLIKRRRTGKIKLETLNNLTGASIKNVLSFEGRENESAETFMVTKDNLNPHKEHAGGWCKTNRYPYTTDVYICLILMYDLGMLRRFHSDDMNEQYPEALAYVKSHYALKNSYEKLQTMGQWENNMGEPLPTPSVPKGRARKYTRRAKGSRK